MTKRTCSVEDCDRSHKGYGLCGVHLKRWKLYGSTDEAAATEKRFWAKVAKTDGCWLWLGALRENGYGKLTIRNRQVRAHRYSFELHYGYLPHGDIDHRCGNRKCVRPDHLRSATRKENLENYTVLNPRNKSGYRGVHLDKYGKFVASVVHNGKNVPAGRFETAEEADHAAREKRLELFTHNDRDRT